MDSSLTFIEPKSETLKQYIKTYYFHSSNDSKFYQKIIYYPNYTTTLNTYLNSKLTWTNDCRTHSYDANETQKTLLVGKFNKARTILTKGIFNKISIVFYPLGINQFLTEPLSYFISEHFAFFNHFGKSYEAVMDSVFLEPNIEKKRDLLDQFFMSQYCSFSEPKLIEAVSLILNSVSKCTVNSIAISLNISRRSLLRLFRKHLDYSVEEYMLVVKFRKMLIHHQRDKCSKFTSTALQANYYDQSDFNRHVKEFTGCTPKELFVKMKTLEEGLFWNFVDKN